MLTFSVYALVGVDERVGPAHKHPEGALCATGGFYPPLQLRRQSRRRVDMLVDPYQSVQAKGLHHLASPGGKLSDGTSEPAD